MNSLAEKFKHHPHYHELGARRAGFDLCMKHLDSQPASKIIETGASWVRGSWEGQGQSTLIWDWVLQQEHNRSCYTFEISPESIATARSQTTMPIHFIEGDSVKSLNEYDSDFFQDVSLVYLDSFDWTPELQMDSAFHHMSELTAMWRYLRNGTLIMVDDRHAQFAGKHLMVQFFLEKLGYKPIYEGYQIAWIK